MTKDKNKGSDQIEEKCILLKANSYQYANMRLAGGNGSALLFLIQGGSFLLQKKHVRIEKKNGMD